MENAGWSHHADLAVQSSSSTTKDSPSRIRLVLFIVPLNEYYDLSYFTMIKYYTRAFPQGPVPRFFRIESNEGRNCFCYSQT